MVKKVLFKSTFLLILFILANLYFAIFNWKIFTVKLNINFGFAIAEIPVFIVLFLLGFIFLGILSWMNYNIRLQKMIYDLEHGVEIGKLKDRLDNKKIQKLIFEENNLKLLKEKMGVEEILKKQAEIMQLVSGLKENRKGEAGG
jgi:energy-coupling factor transporter transmembrane protein EcfT